MNRRTSMLWAVLAICILCASLSGCEAGIASLTDSLVSPSAVSGQTAAEAPPSRSADAASPTDTQAPEPTPSPALTPVPTPVPTAVPISTSPPAQAPSEPITRSAESVYVINTNTGKFHYSWCASVGQIKEENRWDFNGSRDEIIEMGYVPCKKCNP